MEKTSDDIASLARTPAGEACLVGRVAAGDRRAFETLYRAYFPRLTRFLQRMTRSAPLIEEIVNDTLLAVWRKAATFDGSSKVSTWVFAIAYRRACKALQALDEPVEALADEREGLESDRPEWQFDQGRLAHAVDAALATLPLAQRIAFQLTFYHDMTYPEIADIMECPVNTIKTRMFHTRKRLAVLLDGQLENRP
ncbi:MULTISPECIES: RNA polymerase sigma factor [unclassified Massilia]|uniref:RNA polymerase sigma factor n=1 Tax=unclassified Massilia TaxID=2609279 RepID=UPI001E6522BF|nr:MULTISPECIES: sigma-70 family RNA polymerase sigma factor [unclassified Massilia]